MELLNSKKFRLPTLYFISDRDEIKELPVGVPFIYGDEKDKKHIIRILEYEILYQKAIKSGYPFDFKGLLNDAGYEGLEDCDYYFPAYMNFVSEGSDYDIDITSNNILVDSNTTSSKSFDKYIRDSAAYVDVQKLKNLNVFPIWLSENIEKAIQTNIHNFAVFNPNMYNKKLDGMYGSVELSSPNKNLIIIDISSSIPKAVSSTCLTLSKNLAETFYADLLITGSKSILYSYEEIYKLNINSIYDVNGMNNEAKMFRKLLFGEAKHYKTAIVFGDNHSPCGSWGESGSISREEAQKQCKWKVDKLISFHTENTNHIAGYADFFTPIEEERINNWVKYLK